MHQNSQGLKKMRSTFDTPYDEEFARLCIMRCFPELKLNLERALSDPPDLIDNEKDVGVEVVRATTRKKEQLRSAFSQYSGANKEYVPDNLRKKINDDSQGLIYDDDNMVIGADFGISSDLYGDIINSVLNKTKRLNSSTYPGFQEDMLFVFNSDGFCFENGLQSMFSEISKMIGEQNRCYTTLFVYCSHTIFMVDENRVEYCEMTDADIEDLKRTAINNLGRMNS